MNFTEFKNKYEKKRVEEVPNSVKPNPEISILVQTYNQENYIWECLDSILNQDTDFDFEIIVGEDDSTDSTRKICLEYAKKYPEKIRLILHHRENQIKILGTPTSNFNALYNFYSSKGKYIAFCEGDDFWTDSKKLYKQVKALERNKTDSFNYHSYLTIDSMNIGLISDEEANQPKTDLSSTDLFKGTYHPLLLTICFRKNFEELPYEIAEVLNIDTFLYVYLGRFGNAKYLVNISPSYYRKHRGGTWSLQKKTIKYRFKSLYYQNLITYFTRLENQTMVFYYTKILKNSYKSIVLMELKNGHLIKAFNNSYKLLKLQFYP